MSKKSFILLALIINLTICITLCIVLFTGTAGKIAENNIKDEGKENSENIQENIPDEKENTSERPSNQAIVNIEDATIPEEENSDNADSTGENGSESIVEMQVETDTIPYNYKNDNEEMANDIDHEENVHDENEQIVDSQSENAQTGIVEDETETVEVTGTLAYLRGGCNIRSYRNVADNIIGYANEGQTYRIEPSQCTASWVAIYVDDTTIGYIAADFCHIEN